MKSKIADIPYCGVDKEKILKAKPILDKESVKIWYKWIVERYAIRIKKDVLKQPKPWTTYKPFLNYKFTNVRREHDRETRWLIKNLVNNSKLSYENKLLNVALFRLYNKSKTNELFNGWIDFFNIDNKFLNNLEKIFLQESKKESLFTNAFFVSGIIRSLKEYFNNSKMYINPIKLILKNKDNFLKDIKKSSSQKEAFLATKNNLFGVGDFLSYQIYVDMTYIKEFPFSENEFTIAGPGCIAGLNLIFKNRDGLSYEECLFWLRNNQEKILNPLGFDYNKIFWDLPKEDRRMNIMSIENQMCEHSKHYKLLKGIGRPKVKYPGLEKIQSEVCFITNYS